MIVISDTSPILNLARIGRLDLLPLLYRRVLIPSAVYEELIRSKSDLPPAIELASLPWLIVATANDQKRVQELGEYLDRGEAEAIACNRASSRPSVGGQETRASGCQCGGPGHHWLLGGIASAKRAGLIDLAKPLVDELIRSARFWIGPDLYAEVLSELGER